MGMIKYLKTINTLKLFLKKKCIKGNKMNILNLPLNIIIGNIISFFSSIALVLSCVVNDKTEAYKYQTLEALILTVSSAFFYSWAGMLTMFIAALRNYLAMKDKLSFKLAVMFILIALIICPIINNYGWIGLLPMFGIIQLTICNYYLKNIKWIKLAIIIDLFIYAVYFIGIYDFISCATQLITAVIGLISFMKLINDEKKAGY